MIFLKDSRYTPLTKYAVILLFLFGICYMPIEGRAGFGIIKLSCMASAVLVLVLRVPFPTKAFVLGTIYLLFQFLVASMHPLTFRSSTLFFSAGLVYTFVCFYNMLYKAHVFTIDLFIKICRWMMMAFFVVCVIQQMALLAGFKTLPAINLVQVLDRGIGCNSLSMEPSTFARTMLVFYYCYVKCCEYVRGEGGFTLKELFQGRHKWVTIRFLWMMCTMGSGTAFVCLMAFGLYFVKKNNWYYIIPAFLAIYLFVLPMFDAEQLNRATRSINATSTFDQEQVQEADGSAGSRISPIINSLKVDLSDPDVWLGHGIDYAANHNLVLRQKATLFDDYGLLFYIIALIFDFTCAYRIKSLGCVFLFMGLAGGAGTNIHYAWWLMMVMACQRYFYENRFDLEYDEEEDDEDDEDDEVDIGEEDQEERTPKQIA